MNMEEPAYNDPGGPRDPSPQKEDIDPETERATQEPLPSQHLQPRWDDPRPGDVLVSAATWAEILATLCNQRHDHPVETDGGWCVPRTFTCPRCLYERLTNPRI